MMTTAQWVRRTALLPLLVGVGCRTSTSAFPQGSYVTTVGSEELASVTGSRATQAATAEWELRLGDGGAFEILTGDSSVVRGRYAVARDTVTFTDESGPYACVGHDQGIFTWRAQGDSLVLNAVRNDNCPARALVMTIRPLRRK